MSFTDEDLKRLKDEVERQRQWGWEEVRLSLKDGESLLARLDCAEIFVKEAQEKLEEYEEIYEDKVQCGMDTSERLEMRWLQKNLKAWLASKGEK